VKSPEFIYKPPPSNLAHCVAFVLDASEVDNIPEKIMDMMKTFRELVNQRRKYGPVICRLKKKHSVWLFMSM